MANLNNSNNSQDWTVERLVNFRKYMANAFSPSLKAEANTEVNTWTTESLISMSESLARAYCPGL